MGSKLNFSLISKRLTCLNSQAVLEENLKYHKDEASVERIASTNKKNSDKIYTELKSIIAQKASGKGINIAYVEHLVEKYINSMSNKNSATDQWFNPLEIAMSFNEYGYNNIATSLVYGYTTRIMPYMEISVFYDIEQAIRYKDVTLSEDLQNSILDSCKLLTGVDRILENHYNLSKRYNMDSLVDRYKTSGMKYFIDSTVLRVNTYPNIEKHNRIGLVLEESTYLLEKYGVDYDITELLRYTLENYLLEERITKPELNNIFDIIDHSIVLEKEDIDKVYDIYNTDSENYSITNTTAKYYTYSEKTLDNLFDLVKMLIHRTSKEDIMANFDKLLYFLWDIAKSCILESKTKHMHDIFDMLGIYITSCTDAMNKLIDADKNFNKNDISILISTIDTVKGVVVKYGAADNEYKEISEKFNQELDLLRSKLLEADTILYPDDNVECIKACIIMPPDDIPYAEYKEYKHIPFINTVHEFDKFINLKESNESFDNISDICKSFVYNEDITIDNYIGLDNMADVTIRQYMEKFDDSEEMTKFAQSVVKEYNNMLKVNGKSKYKAYYLAIEGAVEIHLKDSQLLNINETQAKSIFNTYDVSSMYYTDMLEKAEKDLKSFDSLDFQLEDYLTDFSKYDKFDKETFDLVIECLKYIDSDSHLVQLFAEKFNNYHFANLISLGEVANISSGDIIAKLATQEKVVQESVRNWESKKISGVPYGIQLEAASYLVALLENLADDWDDIEDDEDDEDEKDGKKVKKSEKEEDKENEEKLRKDPKYNKDAKDAENWKPSRSRSKISLNSLKLGIMGLHNKFKEMNNKEKEVSKNLDNSVRALVKSMKGMFISDRREAIIKGSLIPSFSRCIKNGIALAGLGIATKGVVVPAIVAIGGIALSKRLTHKERLLLLDDIETELDVVEKELAIAESNNKMNQYRALLQYKKELQRQYQRIRYNIRVGKDILPGSATGVGNGSNS